jgi:uncharacterized protein YegL
MEGFLYLPVDNDICIYAIKYSCEGREVDLVCRDSRQAEEIFESARMEGQECCMMNKPKDRVSKIELGNIPPGASSSPNSIFFKFPFESCNPMGVVVALDSEKIESFLFEHEIQQSQRIDSVSSNLGGTWVAKDANSGVFRLTRPARDSSLIVTTKFAESMIQSTAVQFGEIISVFNMPRIPESELRTGQEYIFVLDCSGSMGGDRIKSAISCLQLYLHSLPCDGYFNIVRFGSKHSPMWPHSEQVNDANMSVALEYVQNLKANLGGTKMSKALLWILRSRSVFRHGKRQLFILTDGEDSYPDLVMDLVSAHRSQIRCFTIGFGHGADPGLVKGIAARTNGLFDFVCDGTDLRSKVIP